MSLSAERLDAIDAHHSPTIYDSRKICDRCGISWPCDRAAMVADLRAARAENEKLREMVREFINWADGQGYDDSQDSDLMRSARAATAAFTVTTPAGEWVDFGAAVGLEEETEATK